MDNSKELIEQEKAKRKELSRVRIFWLLVILDVLLIAYLIIQFVILSGN